MSAERIHLVRHAEVDNPDRVLYGRLTGYPLTSRGRVMASGTADYLAQAFDVTRVISSPLLRATESAEPIASAFHVVIETDERIIEASNKMEGLRVSASLRVVLRPRLWRYLVNPLKPSWGEPFDAIARRMIEAATDAWESTPRGDVVLVSHELPIWLMHRVASGQRLPHDPRRRRCSRSSVTSFERRDGRFIEVGYAEPGSRQVGQ